MLNYFISAKINIALPLYFAILGYFFAITILFTVIAYKVKRGPHYRLCLRAIRYNLLFYWLLYIVKRNGTCPNNYL